MTEFFKPKSNVPWVSPQGQTAMGVNPVSQQGRFGFNVQSPFGSPFQQQPQSPWRDSLNAMMQGDQPQPQAGGFGGFIGKVGEFAGKHKDALGLAGNVAGGLFQAKMSMDENKRREREATAVEEERERKRQKDANLAPLRAQLIQMMLGNSGGQ